MDTEFKGLSQSQVVAIPSYQKRTKNFKRDDPASSSHTQRKSIYLHLSSVLPHGAMTQPINRRNMATGHWGFAGFATLGGRKLCGTATKCNKDGRRDLGFSICVYTCHFNIWERCTVENSKKKCGADIIPETIHLLLSSICKSIPHLSSIVRGVSHPPTFFTISFFGHVRMFYQPTTIMCMCCV